MPERAPPARDLASSVVLPRRAIEQPVPVVLVRAG
jgi:hypothetical protein